MRNYSQIDLCAFLWAIVLIKLSDVERPSSLGQLHFGGLGSGCCENRKSELSTDRHV